MYKYMKCPNCDTDWTYCEICDAGANECEECGQIWTNGMWVDGLIESSPDMLQDLITELVNRKLVLQIVKGGKGW